MVLMLTLWAQAPSEYLGFGLDNWYYYEGVLADTLMGDPMKVYALYDTSKITEQFTYQGHNAFTVYAKDSAHSDTYGDTVNIRVDTAYDNAPWLMMRSDITQDTTVDLYAYRTPFVVGDYWSTGLAGTYYWDIDGDAVNDTVTIMVDTTYVEAQEDKSVPVGTFNCYRLYIKTRGSVQVTSGADSGQVITDRWEWWHPGTGLIADTTHTEYIGFYMGSPISVYQEWRSHNLVDYSIDVRETPGPTPTPGILIVQGLGYVRISSRRAGALAVYDASGRQVFQQRLGANAPVIWQGEPGAYVAVVHAAGRSVSQGFVLR